MYSSSSCNYGGSSAATCASGGVPIGVPGRPPLGVRQAASTVVAVVLVAASRGNDSTRNVGEGLDMWDTVWPRPVCSVGRTVLPACAISRCDSLRRQAGTRCGPRGETVRYVARSDRGGRLWADCKSIWKTGAVSLPLSLAIAAPGDGGRPKPSHRCARARPGMAAVSDGLSLAPAC